MSEVVGDTDFRSSRTRRRTRAHLLLVLAWLVLIFAGGAKLLSYQNAPGEPAEPGDWWPAAASFRPASETTTLLLFAHPRCPCTRATVGELARLMKRGQRRLEAHALFFKPADADEDWARTDLWQSAAAIPGVHPRSDPDGRLARLFGAQTSGQTLLYRSDGKLLFRGGITASRGHAGDNVGSSTILSLLDDPQAAATATSVFGCSLKTPDESDEK